MKMLRNGAIALAVFAFFLFLVSSGVAYEQVRGGIAILYAVLLFLILAMGAWDMTVAGKNNAENFSPAILVMAAAPAAIVFVLWFVGLITGVWVGIHP